MDTPAHSDSSPDGQRPVDGSSPSRATEATEPRFPGGLLPPRSPRSAAWRDLASIHRFAFTQAVGLAAIELVLLLAILGVIGVEYGAFDVTWRDRPPGTAWWQCWRCPGWAVFWNGVALGLLFCTTAYLTYLLYARDTGRAEWGGVRRRLYLGKAVPVLVLGNLPALLPVLFNPAKVPDWTDLYGTRLYFTLGCAAAVAAFVVAVELVTVRSFLLLGPRDDPRKRLQDRAAWRTPRRPPPTWLVQLRDAVPRTKSAEEWQADGLFAAVLFAYAALVGYTLVDTGKGLNRWVSLGVAVTGVLAAVTWYVARARRTAGRVIGGVVVTATSAGVLYVAAAHWFGTGGPAGWWMVVPVGFVAWLAGVLLRSLVVHKDSAAGVAYSAAAVVCALVGGTIGCLVGNAIGTTGGTVLPAAASVCLLLAALGAVYGVLRFYALSWFYPVVFVTVGVLVLFGSVRPHPHQVEELAGWYRRPDDPARDGAKPSLANYAKFRTTPLATPQLTDDEVLRAWQRACAEADLGPAKPALGGLVGGPAATPAGAYAKVRKPPLVLVATAGGASTSAVYTFAVLTEIEKQIPGFRRHVRIMSGASGGMVGAAVYRVWVRAVDAEEGKRGRRLSADEIERVTEPFREGLEKDFLSPMVQALAFKDLPMGVACPYGYWDDRGRRLERAWEDHLNGALNDTLAALRAEEQTGRFPSLVFSPMMVEDGRPLFISTLDLDYLAVRDPGRAASRTRGLEFLKLFPGDGWTLRLGTAARLSAGFPYFSPAATLPTTPPRRVVDAGYYDNYGMAVALGWVEENYLWRGWLGQPSLADYASRVIVLELRPYLAWGDSALTGEERDAGGRTPQFVWPFQELTTPPEGGEAARKTAMINRNNDQLTLLDWALPATPDEYLTDVVFKADLRASLNWTLPGPQLDAIHRAVGDALSEAVSGDEHTARNREQWKLLRAAIAR